MPTPKIVYSIEELRRMSADAENIVDAYKNRPDIAVEVKVRYDPSITPESESDSVLSKYTEKNFFLVKEQYRYLLFAFKYFGWIDLREAQPATQPKGRRRKRAPVLEEKCEEPTEDEYMTYEDFLTILQAPFADGRLDFAMPSVITVSVNRDWKVSAHAEYAGYRADLFDGCFDPVKDYYNQEKPEPINKTALAIQILRSIGNGAIPVFIDTVRTPKCEHISIRTSYKKFQDDALERFRDRHDDFRQKFAKTRFYKQGLMENGDEYYERNTISSNGEEFTWSDEAMHAEGTEPRAEIGLQLDLSSILGNGPLLPQDLTPGNLLNPEARVGILETDEGIDSLLPSPIPITSPMLEEESLDHELGLELRSGHGSNNNSDHEFESELGYQADLDFNMSYGQGYCHGDAPNFDPDAGHGYGHESDPESDNESEPDLDNEYDVLLWNPLYEVVSTTEGAIAVSAENGRWVTPHIASGAPWSPLRQLLLELGVIEEYKVPLQAVRPGDEILLLSDAYGVQRGILVGELPEIAPKRERKPKSKKFFEPGVAPVRRRTRRERLALAKVAEETSESLQKGRAPGGSERGIPGTHSFRMKLN